MYFSLISVALCVVSVLAAPLEQPADQSGKIQRRATLCPGAKKGSTWTDHQHNKYQIYCGEAFQGSSIHGTDSDSFESCIEACDIWNLEHMGGSTCQAVTYSHAASPTCDFFNIHGAMKSATGVNSAVRASSKTFSKVDLPAPKDWIGGNLYPKHVIKMFSAKLTAYNFNTWSRYVLSQCKSTPGCTSTLSFAAQNYDPQGGRFWYGTIYNGGHTTAANYTRDTGGHKVDHSIAYTI